MAVVVSGGEEAGGGAAAMAGAEAAPPTSYDAIAYLSNVAPQGDPDRLSVIARLHGVDAPPVATARVLEVGGGDGLNLSAFAAAFPDSRCLSFDLAATAVARGRALAEAAGLANIRIERHDAIEAAATLTGEFDYIIVHGVYAWVPAPVRAAIFRLIGRVLAPNGVAFVSYNALPGQVLSQTLRAMVDAMLAGLPRGEDRVDRSIALLREFADAPAEGDNALVTALRARAKTLAGRPRALLAHDEFGEWFEPQGFGEVCAAAAEAGLAYLNDAVYRPWEDGFAGAGLDEAALRHAMVIDDHRRGCLFRHSLFVRQGVAVARSFDPARAAGLWLSSRAVQAEPGQFVEHGERFGLGDQRLSVVLAEAARRYPERFSLEGLDGERIEALVQMFFHRAVWLSTGPIRAGGVSARPRVSPLVRAQIERGDEQVAGLDGSMTPLSEDFRRLLLLLDGTRDAGALAREVGIGEAEAAAFVGLVALRAMLMP